jgi:hypothetical protein
MIGKSSKNLCFGLALFSGGLLAGRYLEPERSSGITAPEHSDSENQKVSEASTDHSVPLSSFELSKVFGNDSFEILKSKSPPRKTLDAFRARVESGSVSPDEISILFESMAAKWPHEAISYLATFDEKVSRSLNLKGIVLSKIARHHPNIAIDWLANAAEKEVTGEELFRIGVELFSHSDMNAAAILRVPEETRAVLQSAATEAALRRGGVPEMIQTVGQLDTSSRKEFDKDGNLIRETSGSTSSAIDDMGRLLSQTKAVDYEYLASRFRQAPWWGNPMETYSAMKLLAKIDAGRALILASETKGPAAELAMNGAFNAAAEFHPEIALDFLSKTRDIHKQNTMLQLLAQKTTDKDIRQECEQLLTERGISMGWKTK